MASTQNTFRRKAVCVGISYGQNLRNMGPGWKTVAGVDVDARKMTKFLQGLGYSVELLLDDNYESLRPTKQNIFQSLGRLVEGVRADDRLFFYFAGHGTQITNTDGTEQSGKDDVLLPCDCRVNPAYPEMYDRKHWFQETIITDNELFDFFLKSLPQGCYLNVVIDACSSGTALDLGYNRICSPVEGIVEFPSPVQMSPVQIAPGVDHSPGEVARLSSVLPPPEDPQCRTQSFIERKRPTMFLPSKDPTLAPPSGPIINYWGACLDGHFASGNDAGGLFSTEFLNCFHSVTNIEAFTYKSFFHKLHDSLKARINCINLDLADRECALIPRQIPEFASYSPPDMNAHLVF